MQFNELTKYLGSNNDTAVVQDPFWNNVLLLLRLDGDTNTKGLPFYKDYSKYQYHVRYREGSATGNSSAIKTVVNQVGGTTPAIPANSAVNVPSFTYLPNLINRSSRINEINSGLVNTVNPSYLDVRLNGNPDFQLGQSDFTLELSFYAEELNLPWKFQTLYAAGRCLYVNGGDIVQPSAIGSYITFPPVSVTTGYGLFIKGDKLKFFANNTVYDIYVPPLNINTWYHVAVQRQGNNLKTFINGVLETSFSFSSNLDMYYEGQALDRYYKTVTIGATYPFSSYNAVYGVHARQVETAFSGALSNLRLTKNARYLSSFYTVTLPHPVLEVSNKLDDDYASTLVYMPCTYDYYDYGSKRAHIQDKALLKTIPALASHSLHLKGDNVYKTKNVNSNLSANDWCMEFYLIPYVNNTPLHLINSPITAGADYTYNVLSEKTWRGLLFGEFNLATVYGQELDESIPLIRITTAQKKKILDVDMRLQSRNFYNQQSNEGTYFSAKLSTNGETWVTFPSETGMSVTNSPVSYLPDDEIKFGGDFRANYGSDMESTTDLVPGAYSQNRYHIAIQKTNQNIYFFINGKLNKTLSINTALYIEGNIEVWLGGDYVPLTGKREYYSANSTGDYVGVDTNFALTFGISGVRLTNASRYDIALTNDVQYDNSFQPVPISLASLPPSRARVIDIIRNATSDIVSTQSVSWTVYVNQDIDGLSAAEFTLTSEAGLTGATITSLTKLNNFQYRLVADVGTGNGTLTPNFNDSPAVLYGDTNMPISYYAGELSISGEPYKINKTRPSALLESGSNPYINSKFLVYLQFDGPIATFNVANIGIENASITKHRPVTGTAGRYELEITPLTEGVINIKALEGTGISDTALPSTKSNTLTRVFKAYFPILQTPFNIGNAFSDISPTRALLTEIIPNNTTYDTTAYPLGESSALSVSSLAEQGGFKCSNFNAVGGLLNVDNTVDWTIEFFLRINSTVTGTSKRAHIFSIEGALGLSVSATNGKLVIGRNPSQLTNLFSDVIFADRATPAFLDWALPGYTQQQKFPHFAISKKGDVFRFYINGKRVGISKTSTLFNITKGALNIGYYPVNVNDVPYLLSNLRITYGKALYTTYEVNVPYLPYEELPNITDFAEVLNYVSIYSNNTNSQVAKSGDTVRLKFSSIVNLLVPPVVTIQGQAVSISKQGNNYTAEYIVTTTSQDSTCAFTITVPTQLGINQTVFTKTTNNSYVVIDNSDLQIVLTSYSLNDSNYIVPLVIEFSEPVPAFTLNQLALTNCVASNLYKVPNTNNYFCTLTGLSSGLLQAQILSNNLTDLAGNYNLASNTFTRTVTVPAYIPDAHWDNVTLLIQPSTMQGILDTSDAGAQVVNSGVTVTSSNSPAGISRSMYFDGQSSLNVTGQSLDLTEQYTVEMFIYSDSLTSLRLPAPVLNPANNLSTNGFTLSWDTSLGSEYLIDVATDSAFVNTLPGYKRKSIGTSGTHTLQSNSAANAPKLASTIAVSSTGFIVKWSDNQEPSYAYKVDISRDELFTDTLSLYSNKLSTDNYLEVGTTRNGPVEKVIAPPTVLSTPLTVSNTPVRSGHILTGLLKDGTGYPQLDYFLEESSIRFYGNDKYYSAAVAEDIELFKWLHVAIVNDVRYTYLYVAGELVDRIKNTGFTGNLVIGHSFGFFKGYMTGIRITKGISRYSGSTYTVPTLPFPSN